MRNSILRLCVIGLLAYSVFAQAMPAEKTMLGFSPENAARQKALEARFDSSLRRENLREWMKRLSARPHHVGSPYDRENAEFMASLFKSWGYDTQIESFDVLFPTPKTRVLELLAPEKFTTKIEE